MAALLRILSKADDGTVESLIIPIESILQFHIVVKEADELSAESLVKDTPKAEDSPADENESQDNIEESKLTITKIDGTEQEINTLEKQFTFEIRDEEGEIVVTTNNLYKLEQGFLVSHILNDKIRNDKVKTLLKN